MMKIEELAKIVSGFQSETGNEISRVQKEGVMFSKEMTKFALIELETRKKMLDFIRALIEEPNDEDPDSLTVSVSPESKVATIRTPGRYKDQDTTLMVRVSEIPDSEEFRIEYLHTEDSGEVLQETFYCQRKFWDLVQHEVEKLKKFKKYNSENLLGWKV